MREVVRLFSNLPARLVPILLVAGGCGSLTSMDLIVYQPTVSEIGEVRCSENGNQQFRLTGDDFEVIAGVIPEGADGAYQYVLHVLVIADEETTAELGPVELTLKLTEDDESGSASGEKELALRPTRNAPLIKTVPMSGRGPSRTWMHKFRIDPDLNPYVHTNLSLSISVDFKDQDGEVRQFDVTVPLAPRQITIPTSVV